VVLNQTLEKNNTFMRRFVAITPMAGAIAFPLLVPLAMVRFGIPTGVGVALVVSTIWFVSMLRTSEMPH